jgi:DNA-binding CsgD family transcriptional regulator
VTGDEFYGREGLRAILTGAPDRAIYVQGTRRTGKTSLLRQVALDLAPLGIYVDLMQAAGSANGQTVLDEARLVRLLRRELARLSQGSPALAGTRAAWDRAAGELCPWLEEAAWAWEEHGATVTLLWDEAELLLRLAVPTLMGLRGLVQSGVGLRLILCASKGLAAINDRWRDEGSPFLFGFRTCPLRELSDDEAQSLMSRRGHVSVGPEVAAAIRAATGNHPYLVQLLCDRLYAGATLRAPQRRDLLVDDGLSDLFRLDIAQLSPGERAVLLAAARHGPLDTAQLATHTSLEPEQAERFAAMLVQTGQICMSEERWAVGNLLLERWLRGDVDVQPPLVSDRASLEVATQQDMGQDERRPTEPLSERERTVLRLMAAGQRNGDIAEALIVSGNTIKAHVKSIYRKLRVSDRVQAINRGRELGII